MKKKLLIILILDLAVLGFEVYRIKPDPSVSIYLIFYIPFLFGINLLAGLLILLFQRVISKTKNNDLAYTVLINSIIAPVIFYFLFAFASDKSVSDTMKMYNFTVEGNSYELTLYLKDKGFRLDQIVCKDSYQGIFWGDYRVFKDTIYYVNDTVKMKIFDHTLTGFPLKSDGIQLKND